MNSTAGEAVTLLTEDKWTEWVRDPAYRLCCLEHLASEVGKLGDLVRVFNGEALMAEASTNRKRD